MTTRKGSDLDTRAASTLSEEEIEERLRERPDLFERLNKGDAAALVDLLEVGTGATVTEFTVRHLA